MLFAVQALPSVFVVPLGVKTRQSPAPHTEGKAPLAARRRTPAARRAASHPRPWRARCATQSAPKIQFHYNQHFNQGRRAWSRRCCSRRRREKVLTEVWEEAPCVDGGTERGRLRRRAAAAGLLQSAMTVSSSSRRRTENLQRGVVPGTSCQCNAAEQILVLSQAYFGSRRRQFRSASDTARQQRGLVN